MPKTFDVMRRVVDVLCFDIQNIPAYKEQRNSILIIARIDS